MEKIGWRFPPLSGGNEQGYTNSGIETFKGVELMDNLAREICQNSLDAKIANSSDPVMVTFDLKKLKCDKYDVFSEYKKCIDGCKLYWGKDMDNKLEIFIKGAENTLSCNDIGVLVASDYNTTGLIGSRQKKGASIWRALAHSDGTSLKNNENSGGSYGIGKNAPFACSSLSMVFYNTYATDGGKAFQGVARLATILDSETNKETQGVGHYQKNGNDSWSPIFDEDSCDFRDLFKRDQYGTDIIIVGFNEEENWISKIEKAVIKNFFLAIFEGKLIVQVQKEKIDAKSLADKIKQYIDDKGIKIVDQLFSAVTIPDKKESLSIFEEKDAEVYIKADKSYNRTIAKFRATGMLVGKGYKQILQHYAAVLVIRGAKLGELLLATEPPRHNRWDYKLINAREKEKRKEAKRVIEEIDEAIVKLLKSQYEVVAETTIDSGEGEYLPDEVDDMGNITNGEDILRINQKAGSIKRKDEKPPSLQQTQGHKGEGEDDGGNVHNRRNHPMPKPTKPPKVVIPQPGGESGIIAGQGSKIIPASNIFTKRIFQISPKQGIYKAILQTNKNYNNVYIDFSAVGEDEGSDLLPILNYSDNGIKKTPKLTNKVGPISLDKDKIKTLYIHFDSNEKMAINMNVMEAYDK